MEEGGQQFRRETRSLIAHSEDHPGSIHPSLDVYLYHDRSLLQHVLQQLTEPVRVGSEDDLHGRVDVDWPFCCPEGSNHFLHEIHEIHGLCIDGKNALIQVCHIEQVDDHPFKQAQSALHCISITDILL